MAGLEGKRIIVTGGATGMGAAMVSGFAKAGARIAAFYRHRTGDAALAGLSDQETQRVLFLKCDVAEKDEVDQAFSEAAAWLGGLDVMINAAGIAPHAPSDVMTVRQWTDVMNVNALGTVLTNQAAFQLFKDRGGAIINFASASGVKGLPGQAHYAASKGAVIAWTRSLAAEWACYGITVNAIAPAIWTPMYEESRAVMTPQDLAEHDKHMAKILPMGGKLGDPVRDFLPYMVFLAGDGARFITGQTIKIDGGLMMYS